MSTIPALVKELQNEAATTRKMLAAVPNDKYDWQPHRKSMTIRRLATHIGELPSWVTMVFDTNELDFAQNPYSVPEINNTTDLLQYFETNLAGALESFAKATDDDLLPNWTLRNGDQVYSVNTKAEVLRMSYCQIVHHRAQLGVYLRLLDVPIPGSYGPSADEQGL